MNIFANRSEPDRSSSVFRLILGLLWFAGRRFQSAGIPLPAVFEISSTVGLFMGALFSPFTYLSMRHLRFFIRAACYLPVIIAAAVFEMWLHTGFRGAIVTAFSMCIVCVFTQRSSDV